MADGQECNIPLGGYGKGMALSLWPCDIPMPYPPHGILHFSPSAMRSCYSIIAHDRSSMILQIDTLEAWAKVMKT